MYVRVCMCNQTNEMMDSNSRRPWNLASKTLYKTEAVICKSVM